MSGVVITGVGVVSPIGIGPDVYWQSIESGQSGVKKLDRYGDVPLPFYVGSSIPDFDPKAYIKPRKSMKVMCREIQTGFAAAEIAIEHAKIDTEAIESDRFGVVYGSEMFYCDVEELAQAYQICLRDDGFVFDEWGARAINQLYPLWMLRYLPNMTACHVGIRHDARGPNNTIVQGEASSLLAFLEAVRVLERGNVDVMIVGGSGNRLSVTPMLYRGNVNASQRSDAPEKASRPFDVERDGMVYGEGAAAFILERAEYAEQRGAKALARVAGIGQCIATQGDANERFATGVERSITLALEQAQMTASAIGHVQAGAFGMLDTDIAEAIGISKAAPGIPVTAPKSFYGNLGSGSAAVDLVSSVLALEHERIPQTLNVDQVDPKCPIEVVTEQTPMTTPTVLALSQSTTAQAAAVVLEKP